MNNDLLQSLIEILPPPGTIYLSRIIDWKIEEQQLGHPFPEDYKLYMDIYGYGQISDDIIVFQPSILFAEDQNFTYDDVLYKNIVVEESTHRKQIREERLICWGRGTTGGSYFFWKFDSNKPFVVSFDLRGAGREDYPGVSLVEFIYGILTNTITCEATAEGIGEEAPYFTSFSNS